MQQLLLLMSPLLLYEVSCAHSSTRCLNAKLDIISCATMFPIQPCSPQEATTCLCFLRPVYSARVFAPPDRSLGDWILHHTLRRRIRRISRWYTWHTRGAGADIGRSGQSLLPARSRCYHYATSLVVNESEGRWPVPAFCDFYCKIRFVDYPICKQTMEGTACDNSKHT